MAAVADTASLRTSGYGRDLARRFGLTGFGRWWAAQLAEFVPSRLRSALAQRRTRPVLAFDGSRASLWRPTTVDGRVQMTCVAEIPLYADADIVTAGGRAAFAPLLREGGVPDIVVGLSPKTALRKRLTLPAAIESNLHQALAYDLDRHTPFKAEELYFDAIVVDRDAARNTIHVELAAARRALVDPMLRQAESFGARVVGVTIDPPAAAATSRFNLLPEDRQVNGSDGLQWRVVLPAILLVACVLAALVLPIWQKRTEAISLNREADEARDRAGISERLRSELERRVGDYNFALERKYAFPGSVQVLDDITHLLPDDTWLTQLELRSVRGKEGQRELTLRGESANAGRLVSLLEDSKLFTQSAPRSPTTKIQPGPGEIFDVGAQLKPLPAPTPTPLDVSEAAAQAARSASNPTDARGTPTSPISAPAATPNAAPANAPRPPVASQAAPSTPTVPSAGAGAAPGAPATPTTAAPSAATPPNAANPASSAAAPQNAAANPPSPAPPATMPAGAAARALSRSIRPPAPPAPSAGAAAPATTTGAISGAPQTTPTDAPPVALEPPSNENEQPGDQTSGEGGTQ
jgi:general secretion pathway protein L